MLCSCSFAIGWWTSRATIVRFHHDVQRKIQRNFEWRHCQSHETCHRGEQFEISFKEIEILNLNCISQCHSISHLIQIQYVNDTKYITATKQIQFVIHMIEIIEMHGTMKMQDLSSSLKLSFKAFFPFGKLKSWMNPNFQWFPWTNKIDDISSIFSVWDFSI